MAPIIQYRNIGVVSGVRSVIFPLNKRIVLTRIAANTTKSSTRTYTHVFVTSRSGSFGYNGIKTKRKSVVMVKKLFLHHAISFFID